MNSPTLSVASSANGRGSRSSPMPGWINTTRSGNFDATPLVLGRRVGAALLLVVAGIYRWARRRESVQATFLTTLALLAVVIAMAPQIIGDNNATLASI